MARAFLTLTLAAATKETLWAGERELLQRDEGARATFPIDGTRAPRVGEWFRNPDLAAMFRRIARVGGPVQPQGHV